MKTIQMTIDEPLLEQVDETVEELQTTRSAFIREALEQALRAYRVRHLEERDEAGYRAVPAEPSTTVTNGQPSRNGGMGSRLWASTWPD